MLGKVVALLIAQQASKTVIFISKIASLGAWKSCHTPLSPKLPDVCHFLANSGCFCGRGATLRSENPLLVPENLIYDHLMKIKWSVANVTAIRPPFRAESGSFWVILNFFDQFRPLLWSSKNFVI